MNLLEEPGYVEDELPAVWNYSEVPGWRDAVIEYLSGDEDSGASIAVFDTDFDKYWVRLDPGEPGAEVKGGHVDEDELFDEVFSLAAEYNVRSFMEEHY